MSTTAKQFFVCKMVISQPEKTHLLHEGSITVWLVSSFTGLGSTHRHGSTKQESI